jgi:hypothetical protein
MTERHRRPIRLAFEPNRFAAEQLVKAYEELKPLESRTTAMPSASKPANGKRFSMKGGAQ